MSREEMNVMYDIWLVRLRKITETSLWMASHLTKT